MTIFAAGIEADGFNFATGTTYTVSSSTVHRDTVYSHSALGATEGTTRYLLSFASQSALWFHGVWYNQGSLNLVDNVEIIRFDSGTGPEFRLAGTGVSGNTPAGLIQLEKTTDGTNWTTVGPTIAITGNFIYKVDLHITFGGSGVVKLYLNGRLAVDFSGDVTTQTSTADRVRLGAHNTTTLAYWSQVIVSSTPMIQANLQTLQPNAAGTHTSWTNDYTAIDETTAYSEGDSISTDTINNVESWNILNTTGTLINNNVILGLVQTMRCKVETGSTPGHIQFHVRAGGVDYYSGDLSPALDVITSFNRVLETNPNTAAAWTAGNIDAVECGVRAVA